MQADVRPQGNALVLGSTLRRLVLAMTLMIVGLMWMSGTASAQTATPSVTPTPSPNATATTVPTVASSPTITSTPTPSLTLTTQQAPSGTTVGATASAFQANDTVDLLFDGTQLDSQRANSSGTVQFQFTVPVLALGQYTVEAKGRSNGSATSTFTISGTSISLSAQQGTPGSSLTTTGVGFQPGETVQVFFNGALIDSPVTNTTGSWTSTTTVPTLPAGTYQIDAKGQTSGLTASAKYAIGGTTLTLSAQSGAVGSSLTATGAGFTPGDTIQLVFNGANVATMNADINGNVAFTFPVPNVATGAYQVELTGQSGGSASATFNVSTSGPTPVATPTAGPSGPTPTPQPAPPIVHDDRYFSQTGYRIDNDAVYAFFQAYGGVQTFGFPTSRNFNFLGCPVQFYQRQIIQVCAGAGAALINILDPGIFPYTKVNGSTFPAPDPTMKANTPPVSDPNYDANISAFINANVPNTFSGQPVNFLDYFNTQGSLTIWGAPISAPAPDPSNGNFIYQRFQRGIMHYIAGTGTESILVADYLKSMILDQNVPLDLRAEALAQNSPYLKSYCPGQPLWMCQPNQVPGTDYTFAFVPG